MSDNNIFNESILRLTAPVKDYVWGGDRLRDFGKPQESDRIAESWELSCHPDGLSTVCGGSFDGLPLAEVIRRFPHILGENYSRLTGELPVMVKLIDAREDLSVQVHPNEKYAMEHENDHGKNEFWYIIDCEPGSAIVYGLKEKLTKTQFRQAIADNTLLDKVNIVPVEKGDMFMVRSGLLHAIGRGCLVAEIQQTSNVTYRVYDYGRDRELHIDKATDVAKLAPTALPVQNGGKRLDEYTHQLLNSKFFKIYRETAPQQQDIFTFHAPKKSFTHVLVIGGTGRLVTGQFFTNGERTAAYCSGTHTDIKKGDSFFIPAGTDWGIAGECNIIYTTL